MARSRQRVMRDAFSDFEQVPVTVHALGGRMRNWGWLILGSMGAGVAALVLLLVMFVSDDDGGVAAPSGGSSRAAGVASAAMEAWLAGDSFLGSATVDCGGDGGPFGEVASMSWQRAVAVTTGEVHSFVVVADGTVWDAAVTVRFDVDESTGRSFPVVVGCPMVQLAPAGRPVAPLEPWAGWPRSEPAEKFVTQARAWADAYFSVDGDALFRVTGDTESARRYQPVGGLWRVVAVNVDAFSAGDGSAALAQVSVETDRGVFTFDLLFGSPADALPPVVAWGPVGVGPLLAPYVNAVGSPVSAPTSTSTTVPASTSTSTTVPASTSSSTSPPAGSSSTVPVAAPASEPSSTVAAIDGT